MPRHRETMGEAHNQEVELGSYKSIRATIEQ